MKILDLVDDVRSGCKSVLTTMTLEEYKKMFSSFGLDK